MTFFMYAILVYKDNNLQCFKVNHRKDFYVKNLLIQINF